MCTYSTETDHRSLGRGCVFIISIFTTLKETRTDEAYHHSRTIQYWLARAKDDAEHTTQEHDTMASNHTQCTGVREIDESERQPSMWVRLAAAAQV
jgi:hypothetical protein